MRLFAALAAVSMLAPLAWRLATRWSALLAVGTLLTAVNANGITFADGQVHVIDANNSFPFEAVLVEDSADGDPTTLDVVAGGEIKTEIPGGLAVEVFDNSIASMSGGTLGGGLIGRSDSRVSVSGGTLLGSVFADDRAIAVVSGGTGDSISGSNDARVEVLGGTFNNVGATHNAIVDIRGGTLLAGPGSGGTSVITASDAPGAVVTIFDGTLLGDIQVNSSSQVIVHGGDIQGDVKTNSSATVQIDGGSFSGELLVLNTSVITILGRDFNLPIGDVTSNSGTISGILSDGTSINVSFARASTARITLVLSEPAPSVIATKEDALANDIDGDGRADPGDTVRYNISFSNAGTADAESVSLSDLPDPNSSLIVGSVTTSQGTVVLGNGPNDSAVQVDIGFLASGGGSATVAFDVLVDEPFPPDILTIANQGQVSGNFDPVVTNDPGTAAVRDATVTQVANTELDICERDLEKCEQDLGELLICQANLTQVQTDLAEAQLQIGQLQNDLAARDATIEQLQNDLAARDVTIAQLQTDLAQCQSELAACGDPTTDDDDGDDDDDDGDDDDGDYSCNDGIDNDGDGKTDYPADKQCGSPEDQSELAPPRECGLGVELALVLPALAAARRRWRPHRATRE